MQAEVGARREEAGSGALLVAELSSEFLGLLEDVIGREAVREGKGDLLGARDVVLGAVVEDDRLWLRASDSQRQP
jgi:hypothetical protein